MKNITQKAAFLSMGLVLFGIILILQKPLSAAFASPPGTTKDLTQPIITNLQVSPDSYNPKTADVITVSFNAKTTAGKYFSSYILDSSNEMLTAQTGKEFKEGKNTINWRPGQELQDGSYTFGIVYHEKPDDVGTEYKTIFNVTTPGFKPLIMSDLKIDQGYYKLSEGPATFSFDIENAQGRHYSFAIFDPSNKQVHQGSYLTLHNGLNTMKWVGNNTLKSGNYTFVLIPPPGSNVKSYKLEFPVINNLN